MSSSTITYGARPKFTLNWSNTAASYVIITYVGNAIVGTATTSTSGAQTGTSWTSDDLSLNATYTFTLTPYNQAGAAGTARVMTVDTTPALGGSLSVGTSTTSGTQISWGSGAVAGANVSYVRIYRQITSPYTGEVEDICAGTYISSSPYYDSDISGNATYTYSVYPYDSGFGALGGSTTFSVSTAAAAARDLTAAYYDASSIKISFTLPKNSYSSSYYYQLNAVYSGSTTSVTGTTSPLWVTGLLGGTTYTCYIDSYIDGTLGETSSGYSVTTSNSYGSDPGTPLLKYSFENNVTSTGSYTNTLTTSNTGGYSTTYYKLGSYSFKSKSNGTSSTKAYTTLSLSANQSITICFWVYPISEWTGAGWLFRMEYKNTSNNTLSIYLRCSYSYSGYSNYFTDAGTASFVPSSNTRIYTNQWTHICAVYSQSTASSTYYINGSSIGSKTSWYYPDDAAHSTSECGINYGSATTNSSGDVIDGYIDDLRIYGSALSDTQVSGIYNLYWT